MRQITYQNVNVDVQPAPNGDVAIVIADMEGSTVHVVPLSEDGAKTIGARLLSPRVQVAQIDQVPGR